MTTHSFLLHLGSALLEAVGSTWRTSSWLLKIMIPVSLAVCLMQYFGLIALFATWTSPLLCRLGLPGEAAVPFITGALTGTYGGIAAMMGMEFTLRQATIVSLMICLCHALPMECAVVKKTGSKFFLMGAIRIVMAVVCAAYLNLVLPELGQTFCVGEAAGTASSLGEALQLWGIGIVRLSLMMVAIIYALMVVQGLLEAVDGIRRISRWLRPLMRVFGIPEGSAYLWLVGNVVGISYGCAVMMELEQKGLIHKDEANEANYHLIMNHSLVEDTIVFAAIGIGAGWIMSTRILFALVLVWARKGVLKLKIKN